MADIEQQRARDAVILAADQAPVGTISAALCKYTTLSEVNEFNDLVCLAMEELAKGTGLSPIQMARRLAGKE